jgi:hypothetical protein
MVGVAVTRVPVTVGVAVAPGLGVGVPLLCGVDVAVGVTVAPGSVAVGEMLSVAVGSSTVAVGVGVASVGVGVGEIVLVPVGSSAVNVGVGVTSVGVAVGETSSVAAGSSVVEGATAAPGGVVVAVGEETRVEVAVSSAALAANGTPAAPSSCASSTKTIARRTRTFIERRWHNSIRL